jgi:hypothetical protein
VTEDATADEDHDSPDDGIEEVEHSHGGHRNHEKQGAFDAHVSEGLVQTLEDSVMALLSNFWHKPLAVERRWR